MKFPKCFYEFGDTFPIPLVRIRRALLKVIIFILTIVDYSFYTVVVYLPIFLSTGALYHAAASKYCFVNAEKEEEHHKQTKVALQDNPVEQLTVGSPTIVPINNTSQQSFTGVTPLPAKNTVIC